MKGRRSVAGFSALEALIAAAILAVALVPLLDMQRQAARQATRLEALQVALSAQRSAIDLLTTINPMAEPVGARAITETLTMRWRAVALTPAKRGVSYLAGPAQVQAALYRIEVTVEAEGQPIRTFEIDQVGWAPTGS